MCPSFVCNRNQALRPGHCVGLEQPSCIGIGNFSDDYVTCVIQSIDQIGSPNYCGGAN